MTNIFSGDQPSSEALVFPLTTLNPKVEVLEPSLVSCWSNKCVNIQASHVALSRHRCRAIVVFGRCGRCVPVDYFTGCAVDVLPALERRCSGRHHCSVPVSDRQLFRVQPCRKDLVAYLELAYRCVTGTTIDLY